MAKSNQRRLGRGLSSLIGEPAPIEPPEKGSADRPAASHPPRQGDASGPSGDQSDALDKEGGVHRVSVDAVTPNRYQPRQHFDDASLESLAASIRTAGVMQPIAVRPLRDDSDAPAGARWELIAGERRWRAARLAGLETVPAVVADLDDQSAAEWSLVENLQREDLNPMDRAWAFRRLQDEFSLTPANIAERVGLDRSTIANLIRLTELESDIRDLLASGALSTGHGKALLGASPGKERIALAKRAQQGGWSVRKLEQAASSNVASPSQQAARPGGMPDTSRASRADLEERLGKHLGTRVQIRTTGAKETRGQLRIEFFDLDHFDDLLNRFGFHTD